MPIIRSLGTLQAVGTRATVPTYPSGTAYAPSGWASSWMGHAYAMIYATQPSVRTCVDFLARNIAQLGFHVFRRVSDTDRVRLTDHKLADWIEHPNPYTTRYRLFESYVADLALYFNAFWLKVRDGDRVQLVRVPPSEIYVEGGLLPSRYVWTVDNREVPIAPEELVYANGYNPLNALAGLSPIETLRQILAEERAAGDHRERYWRNASRMEGVIERPKDAPKWSPEQKNKFREQWQERYAGPQSVGAAPVLEDGMTWRQVSWSMKDSDYLNARKLSREECAALWHIPLPMVGILDHATFSNIKEQHKQLYADCLGPWLEMIQEAIELQLLPDTRDVTNVYAEFNINDKLKGSFEEQATALRSAVGRPFMTANEARARMNLPAITDDPTADQLAAQQGGPAQSFTVRPQGGPDDNQNDNNQNAIAAIVRAHWTRQASRLARVPPDDRADALDRDRCARELAADLTPFLGRDDALIYAARVTDDTVALLLDGRPAFAADRELRAWGIRYADAA